MNSVHAFWHYSIKEITADEQTKGQVNGQMIRGTDNPQHNASGPQSGCSDKSTIITYTHLRQV